MYGFNLFAASLNEPEICVAPTDCRLRPDIRLMEQQNFDKANDEKVLYDSVALWHNKRM